MSSSSGSYPIDDAELRKRLTPEQYRVARERGTERAFSGKYYKTTDVGTYLCIVCEQPLFTSESKFDAGCGWPSYSSAIKDAVAEAADNSHGMRRVEIKCSKCDSHLGHVFDDGPMPTGLRYCVNSASVDLKKK